MNLHEDAVIVLTPVFEDSESCQALCLNLKAQLGDRLYVVVVDDGSVINPINAHHLVSCDVNGTIFSLPRNVGHQGALAVGLIEVSKAIKGDQVLVVMDSDGEDRPEDVPALLGSLQDDEVDIAVATRGRRSESIGFRVFYALYRALFILATGKTIAFGNFMAMTPSAVHRLVTMPELATHLAATVLSSRLRIRSRRLDRGSRYAGESKMNFFSLVLHGFRALMVFADDVLVRVGVSCLAVALLAGSGAAVALVLKIFGHATPGWFSTVVGILFVVVIQTAALTLMLLLMTGILRQSSRTHALIPGQSIAAFEVSATRPPIQ